MNKLVLLSKAIEDASRIPMEMATRMPGVAAEVKPNVEMATRPLPLVSGIALTPSGRHSGFSQIDLSGSSAATNQWVQFDVSNLTSGGTLEDFKVRVGSNLALPDTYEEYGIGSGAADSANVEDQFGKGCLAVRGFSRITCSKPVLVTEIQITSDDSMQLNAEIKTLEIELDGTITPKKINVSATQQKSDQRDNLLLIENVSIIVDSTHSLEFTSKGDKDVTIKLKVEAWSNVGLFMPYGN